MASSSLTVYVNGELFRKFGGNRSSVRRLLRDYQDMSLEEFMKYHPRLKPSDYESLAFITKFNKS